MIYAKLDGQRLIYPPAEFVEDKKRVVGFTETYLRAHGYKPLVESEPSNDNQIDYYIDHGDYIEQIWK